VYTDVVLEHFAHPRNVGALPDADGVGEIGAAEDGDVIRVAIKVDDGRISDVRFQTFGCAAAVASSSMVTEMAMGKTLDEARALTNAEVTAALGGLPPQKEHCSGFAADALHAAIDDYCTRHRA